MRLWKRLVFVTASIVLSGAGLFGSPAAEPTSARLDQAASSPLLDDRPKLSGPYLGQKPPGMTPELFAPGIISMGYFERSVVFSPSQDELFFQLRCLGFTTVLLQMKRKDGLWSRPEIAFISGLPEYYDDSPFYTYDGRRLFFTSRRPLAGEGEIKKDSDIWMLPKIKDAWAEPLHAGNTLNSAFDDDYPTLSRSDNLYFSSNREGNYDLYVSHFSDKGFSEPRRLEPMINTQNFEGHPFIAADESFLIFSSDRPGQLGEGDLYISFKGKNNEWSEPINMGDKINSPFHDVAPYVSPDGRYLFFCSFRPKPRPSGKKRLTFMEVKELLDGPGNGRGDIYWASAKVIDDLRPGAPSGKTASQNFQAALTDVDGNQYQTIKIGDQVWMAENLRVTRDRAGNPIPSYCFDDQETNCGKFGRLYTWGAALKAVPDGWHLPSDAEWKELVDYLGGSQIAGKKLMAGGSSGFEALLAGGADFRGKYLYREEYALFWSSTEVNEERAYHQDVGRNGTSNHFAAKKDARVSVRCIKNN